MRQIMLHMFNINFMWDSPSKNNLRQYEMRVSYLLCVSAAWLKNVNQRVEDAKMKSVVCFVCEWRKKNPLFPQ